MNWLVKALYALVWVFLNVLLMRELDRRRARKQFHERMEMNRKMYEKEMATKPLDGEVVPPRIHFINHRGDVNSVALNDIIREQSRKNRNRRW